MLLLVSLPLRYSAPPSKQPKFGSIRNTLRIASHSINYDDALNKTHARNETTSSWSFHLKLTHFRTNSPQIVLLQRSVWHSLAQGLLFLPSSTPQSHGYQPEARRFLPTRKQRRRRHFTVTWALKLKTKSARNQRSLDDHLFRKISGPSPASSTVDVCVFTFFKLNGFFFLPSDLLNTFSPGTTV